MIIFEENVQDRSWQTTAAYSLILRSILMAKSFTRHITAEGKNGITDDRTCILYSKFEPPPLSTLFNSCVSTTHPSHIHTMPGLRIGIQHKSPITKIEPPGPKAKRNRNHTSHKPNAQNSFQRLANVCIEKRGNILRSNAFLENQTFCRHTHRRTAQSLAQEERCVVGERRTRNRMKRRRSRNSQSYKDKTQNSVCRQRRGNPRPH